MSKVRHRIFKNNEDKREDFKEIMSLWWTSLGYDPSPPKPTFSVIWVPWTARRSNQSILKEISPGISLEGMMLKLKLQYFGHLMQRVDSLGKTLMLGGIGGRRRRGRQRMRWLDGSPTRWTWVWVNSRSWWWTGRPGVLQSMGLQKVRHYWATELNWTELNVSLCWR